LYGRTFGSVIDAFADTYPQSQALVEGDSTYSFIEVITKIREVGKALHAVGVRPGDRVAVAMHDSTELAIAMHAVLWSGSTLVPLNIKLKAADHAYMLEDAAAKVLLCHDKTTELAGAIAEHFKPPVIYTFGSPRFELPTLPIQAVAAATRTPDIDPSSVAWIQYTGGTTGRPKGVVHTHATALTTMMGCAYEYEFERGERHAHIAPLTHSGFATFLPVWMRGGCNIITDGFDPDGFLELVEKERVTSTIMVPTMLNKLLDSPALPEADVSSIRTIVYGAAPITPGTLRRAVEAFGPVLLQSYGQTECFAQISVLSKQDHLDAVEHGELLTSAGRPVLIADVRIGDEDCNEVPTGELGEVLVRGPHVFKEYLNKPEETAAAKAGGWLHTGDIGRRDEHGYLHLVDRKKDVIISGGFNVYPKEVEDILDAHPAVREVCVVGIRDEYWGEKVTAVVVLAEGIDGGQAPAELIDLVKERKGPIYAPKEVVIVDEIPLTTVGKHDKKALVERLASR